MGFNRFLIIEYRVDRLTGDPSTVLLREIVEQSGIIKWTTVRLTDPRGQVDVTNDLPPVIHTGVLLASQGCCDHDDADALRHDPSLQLAASFSAGLTLLAQGGGLASQPTLSRLTALMA